MNIVVIKNKYANRCKVTKQTVPVGDGFAVNRGHGWETYCGDLSVLPQWLLDAIQSKTKEGPVVRRLNADGSIEMPYEEAAIPLLRAMPGSRWDANTRTRFVSVEASDLPRVLELADKLNLDVAPELRKVAARKVAGVIDLSTYESASGYRVFDYQAEGVDFLARRRGHGSLLADDMGLGKTAQSLLSLHKTASKVRAIVVAPAAVRYNWRDEAKEWRPDLTVTVLTGRGSFRWPRKGEIVITGYAILPSIEKTKKSGWKVVGKDEASQKIVDTFPGDVTVIVDEAHRAKNFKTQQASRLGALCSLCETVIGMTGTPLMTRASDLYGVFSSLDLARDTFGSFNTFMKLYQAERGRYGIEWGMPTEEVSERLRRVMMRRLKTEVLKDLPPKRYQTLVVDVPSSLKKKLDGFGFSEKIEECRQIQDAGGNPNLKRYLPDFEDFSKIRAELAMSRLPALVELIEDYEEAGEPLVVFSAHKAPMEAVGAREGWGLITGDTSPESRQSQVERFQRGELKGLACTIIAAGVGLTMTHASTMVFLDKDWTPANNAQAEDRICRIGQKGESCLYLSLVSDHPLDQHVNNLISQKEALIHASIETEVLFEQPEPSTRKGLKLSAEEREALDREMSRDRDEREAEILARLEEELRLLDQKQARERVKQKGWVEALATRKGHGNQKIVVTAKLRAEVEEALAQLAGVCDGAVAKDGQGFNKPDSAVGKWLVLAGLDDDDIAKAAYHLVFKYKQQLGGAKYYPAIYGKK